MTRRTGIFAAAGALGLVAGGGAVADTARGTPPASPPATPASPRVVRVAEVRADATAGEQTYTGIVRARYESNLAFRVGAKIVSRHVEVGQRVAAGTLLFRLDATDYRLVVKAAEAAHAAVTLWSAPGESFPAALRELSPIADPVTRTYQARFTIQNPGPKVALGMTATVHLAPSSAATGYSLPLPSLLRTGAQPAVWVVDRATGKVTLVPVEVREYRHETVVLSAGVKPGQLVVTAGVQKLDAAVTVRAWEGTP